MKEMKQQFLDEVCAEIKAKETHQEIRQELSSHLEDLIYERESMGEPRDEAITWAITQMGNPQALGKELHQIHKPRVPWSLFGVVTLLSAISLIGMGSIGVGYNDINYMRDVLERQSVYVSIGILLMFGMYFIDFRKLKSLSWLLYGFTLAGIILSIMFGYELNGLRRVFAFLGFTIDFISYSPYFFVIALAGILLNKREISHRTWRNGLLEIIILLVPVLILFFVRAFPELVVYMLSSLALYVWVTRHWLKSLVMAGIFLTGGLVYILNYNALKDRIMGALNPNLSETYGYIYRVIQEVITSAGWWGHGFGSVEHKLPYVYSDMLPVYLIHSFGWVGGLLLLGIIFWFFSKLLSTIRAIREPYGQALVVGLGLLLVIKIGYGLAIISGRMVLTSFAFPFLSYGSHVFIEYAAIGLLMGIYRRKDLMAVREKTVTG